MMLQKSHLYINDCLVVVGAVRPPQEDKYDTASDNDISDTEEEISPVAVSRSGQTNTRPFSLGFVRYVLSRLAMG